MKVVTEQKLRLESDLKEKTALVSRRETAARNVAKELLKANEVIKKFQGQVRSENGKVKISAQVIAEQEKLVQGECCERESNPRPSAC